MHLIKNLLADKDGITVIEYSPIAALIAVVIAVSVTNIGSVLSTKFSDVAAAF